MTTTLFNRWFIGALTVGMLLVGPACNRTGENKEVKELSQKAADLEKLNQQASAAGQEERTKLAQAGVNDVRPDPNSLQLTPEQRTALEARIKAEKNSSYQALLQEVLDKDKEIKTLNQKISQLRSILPHPDIAQVDDSHYGLAMRFLRKKGVPEERARELISKVLIMDKIAPGFEVYHYYANGVYGTWVAQGKAAMSPTELQTSERQAIESERDAAKQNASDLETQVAALNAEKDKLNGDIDQLQTEKTNLTKDVATLTATSEAQKASLNSLHYLVGDRKTLVKDGIIVVPVFAKDRAGEQWNDQAFNKAVDLRTEDSITLTAAEAGLQKISKVSVVPGSLLKDKHYTLALNPDHTSATVHILAKDRFRNEKVVFALVD